MKELSLDKTGELPGDDPAAAERNLQELAGRCVCVIFSNQHDVIAEDGLWVHLGSFRGTGDFLAEFLNARRGRREHDSMRFYLGTTAPWADTQRKLTSNYEMIGAWVQ